MTMDIRNSKAGFLTFVRHANFPSFADDLRDVLRFFDR